MKTGPRLSTNWLRWKSKTFVPRTSPGIRSGVNWMRLKGSAERAREGLREQRLGRARHALQQHVALGQQRHQHAGRSPGRARPPPGGPPPRGASGDRPARSAPREHLLPPAMDAPGDGQHRRGCRRLLPAAGARPPTRSSPGPRSRGAGARSGAGGRAPRRASPRTPRAARARPPASGCPGNGRECTRSAPPAGAAPRCCRPARPCPLPARAPARHGSAEAGGARPHEERERQDRLERHQSEREREQLAAQRGHALVAVQRLVEHHRLAGLAGVARTRPRPRPRCRRRRCRGSRARRDRTGSRPCCRPPRSSRSASSQPSPQVTSGRSDSSPSTGRSSCGRSRVTAAPAPSQVCTPPPAAR